MYTVKTGLKHLYGFLCISLGKSLVKHMHVADMYICLDTIAWIHICSLATLCIVASYLIMDSACNIINNKNGDINLNTSCIILMKVKIYAMLGQSGRYHYNGIIMHHVSPLIDFILDCLVSFHHAMNMYFNYVAIAV